MDSKLEDWTVNDQAGNARTPQASSHIGGAGDPVRAVQGADVNDTLSFIEATIAAADGANMGGGVINRTGSTVAIGDRVWGTNTVA